MPSSAVAQTRIPPTRTKWLRRMSKGWKRRKAGRVVRRTLADGTVKIYQYAPYKKAASRVGPESVEGVIRSYKRAPEWENLSPITQAGYLTYLRPLEEAFGSAH